MVRLLVPVPVPDLGCFNRAVPDTEVFSSGRTELTKVSGTGMDAVTKYQSVGYGIDVVPSLPKGRVRVWMSYQAYQRVGMVRLLVPVPVPDLGYFNRAVPDTKVFFSGSTGLTKVSGTDMKVVPNLPKCQVRVWMSYQAYQRVGYGYGCFANLTKGSVWCGCLCPYPYLTSGISTGSYRVPRYFPAEVPNFLKCRVRVWMSYRTYQSVGYGYGNRSKLTQVSDTDSTRGVYPLYTLVRTLPNTTLQNLIVFVIAPSNPLCLR